MDPKISIIVPVYNVEKYLDKCITSILNQTFRNFELIIINDGSNDKSGSICDKYANIDKRVKVIHQNNQGQAVARNKGLKISQGEYIGFVDSDDWINPDMYSSLYYSCETEHSDFSVIGVREVDEDGNYLNKYIPYEISLGEILKRAYPCNKLFKRELFLNNNFLFPEGKYYEDLELIPKLYIKCKKATIISKASYNYLKRNGSTTSSRDAKILDNLWAYTSVKEYLNKENLYYEFNVEFEKGVQYFKEYYKNILYDYPTTFLLKNSKFIINEFNKIGGLKTKEIIVFLVKHLEYVIKKEGATLLRKLKENLV
ncbi:hypothetical protein COJ96_10170 [Bacillus sp. AFS073361]|uniref:glycosyltransferase family 2 protein n=1 Tax=Bacillus sp. AFS073361 TaxID=2033511 RepID=UPI000BF37A24|nr:glycosyltransferase [Bacillus sp. AFS073361]PFP29504.1 hypothetical protein COJ96_10170 [Bacillus sp. AFS073361]